MWISPLAPTSLISLASSSQIQRGGMLFSSDNVNGNEITSRRTTITSFLKHASAGVATAFLIQPQQPSLAYDQARVLTLISPKDKLGLELVEVNIGNPSRRVVAVKSRDPFGVAAAQNIEAGYILPEYSSAKELIQRIQSGPYPIELKFINLAAGGDAIGDMGKPLVTAQDALELSKQNSGNGATQSTDKPFSINVVKKPNPQMCEIQSRRGDVMEIQYIASYTIDGDKKFVYDSSAQRGTGLPYQFVLGSGDMVPGVDLGMYDMCQGEQREIDIPKNLAYGDRGNKLFKIPPGARLNWNVKLISLDSVRF
mmetsp:Transcript_14598/g.21912  ORF Transcript_14598/g.21912 Transcript_14598/m.21912 type:complete len:311 (+) Transcript_14598:37-969(+)